MTNNIYEIAQDCGIITPELARKFDTECFNQASKYWYTKWRETGTIIIHRSYKVANNYYKKNVQKEGEKFTAIELYPAYGVADLNRILMPIWNKFKQPYPLFDNLDATWYWVLPELKIKERWEAEAKRKLIIYLLENKKIKINELYLEKKAISVSDDI